MAPTAAFVQMPISSPSTVQPPLLILIASPLPISTLEYVPTARLLTRTGLLVLIQLMLHHVLLELILTTALALSVRVLIQLGRLVSTPLKLLLALIHITWTHTNALFAAMLFQLGLLVRTLLMHYHAQMLALLTVVNALSVQLSLLLG
jgi:hypothetical protein